VTAGEDPAPPAAPLIRIERGAATAEELAALTVVLLALDDAPRAGAGSPRPPAGWQRPDLLAVYRDPRAWAR
jgi:hypothetical protein